MGADFSRIRSNPLLDFAGVELKQGGVVLDADVNELVAVVDRRLRAAASDILGRSTVSQTTPDAFKITVAGSGLQIGKGRLYVDGLLAENHGTASTDPAETLFDPLMAEPVFADPVAYSAQPYLRPRGLPEAGRHLVYLDVWQREVTHLERPDLVETAVGVETSSRLQTAWQVRVLDDDAGSADCASADKDVAGWAGLIAPSSGRLTTGIFDAPASPDPCELPPTGGYRGLENQTYRVEIHDPGQPGDTATFKWSRENASVGSRVARIISSTELELQTLGRDEVLGLSTGDRVEIIDDALEFAQRCGMMRRVTAVNDASKRITFDAAFSIETPANLRVRRWDHKGKVLQAATDGTTSVFQDLDAGGSGVIDVPASGVTLLLEDGVTVRFTAAGPAGFRAGDYWVFAARTADASIELLDEAPPRGIHHHYARLGIWDVAARTVTDCRTPWPPGSGTGGDCCCTVTVQPGDDLQTVIDHSKGRRSTICLMPGIYSLSTPLRLPSDVGLKACQDGQAIIQAQRGQESKLADGLVVLEKVSNVSLRGIHFLAPRIGVSALSCSNLTIEHCDFNLLPVINEQPFGVAVFARGVSRDWRITASTFSGKGTSTLSTFLAGILVATDAPAPAGSAPAPTDSTVPPSLDDAVFAQNSFSLLTIGALVLGAATVQFIRNQVDDCDAGLWLVSPRQAPLIAPDSKDLMPLSMIAGLPLVLGYGPAALAHTAVNAPLQLRINDNEIQTLTSVGMLVLGDDDPDPESPLPSQKPSSVMMTGNRVVAVLRNSRGLTPGVLTFPLVSATGISSVTRCVVSSNTIVNDAPPSDIGRYCFALENAALPRTQSEIVVSANVFQGRIHIAPERSIALPTVPSPMNLWQFLNTVLP